MLIVFEGPDGSGKSTLMNKVQSKLSKKTDKSIYQTREPGGTIVGKEIRRILMESDYEISERAATLLFIADRAEHFEKMLKDYAKSPDVILLCDRFWETTLVYQSILGDWDLEDFKKMHDLATDGLKPDFTFIVTSDKPHGYTDENKYDKKSSKFREKANILYKSLESNPYIDYDLYKIDTTNKNWDSYISKMVDIIEDNIEL